MLPQISPAEELSVTKTVYLEKGNVVEQKIIVQTHDKGFVIAGGIEQKAQPKSAWATKTDSEGKAIWRYVLPPREKLDTYDGPEYSSAVVMSDDSVFLCGRMPFNVAPGVNQPGLVTHLDKKGKLLKEKLLYPQKTQGITITRLTSCAKSNHGIMVVGNTTQFVKDTSPGATDSSPKINTSFYLVLSLDERGNTQWEKLIPIADKAGYDEMSQLQALGNGFAFTATRNSIGTEVVRISEDGKTVASNVFDDNFTITLPVQPAKDIQLVSMPTKEFTRITLNNELKETGRVTEKHGFGVVDMAYRLPNQSLVAFGAEDNGKGTYFVAQVMYFDSELKNKKAVLLGAKGESYWTKAAIPLDKPGEFVAVRSAIDPKLLNFGQHPAEEQLAAVRLGIGLDFIKLN